MSKIIPGVHFDAFADGEEAGVEFSERPANCALCYRERSPSRGPSRPGTVRVLENLTALAPCRAEAEREQRYPCSS